MEKGAIHTWRKKDIDKNGFGKCENRYLSVVLSSTFLITAQTHVNF
jgi:hypothetical protein